MTDALRILLLEDVPTDAELIEHALRKSGIAFSALRVDSREAFVQALAEFKPDIVLADFKLPAFSGGEALQIMRGSHPEIPVILVSGSLIDETAIELVQQGAMDYVLKNNLSRLGHAVQRALATEHGIRARKAAEREVRAAEQKFRAVFTHARDGIVLVDAESGLIADCNPEFERQCGRKLSELKQLHIWELRPAGMQQEVQRKFKEVRTKGTVRAELGFQRPDGSYQPAEVAASRVQIGERNYIQSISRDISERIQAEAKTIENEERLRLALGAANQAWFDLNIQTGEVHVSPEYARMLGYGDEDFETSLQNWLNNLHPEDHDAVLAAFQACLASGEPAAMEYRRKTRADGWLWMHSVGKVVAWDAAHQPLRMIGIHMDISERKQAEAKLQHAHRALATLSAVNKHLVHADNEQQLLQSVCEAIVRQQGYRMSWVGYVQHDAASSIRCMAHAGHEDGYLDTMRLSWAETARGMGPSGRAIRSGATQLCQDTANDPQYRPWREEALRRGYAAGIGLPLRETDGTVFGLLNVYASEANAFTEDEIKLLEEMAGDLAFGVRGLRIRVERDAAQQLIRQQLAQLQSNLEDTVRVIANLVEIRDPYTAGHQARVADLAAAIAEKMGLPDDRVHGIHLAGVIHDLGKIQVPSEILSKPGKISDIEFGLIKSHAQVGHDILKHIDFPWPIAQIVLQHHERLDGSGYPQGLKGDAILLDARILSVADVVEAMSSHRPYRPGLGMDAALEEIIRGRGTHYDPQAVDACLELVRKHGYVFKG